MKLKLKIFFLVPLILFLFAAAGEAEAFCESNQRAQLEQDMTALLDAAAADPNVTTTPDFSVLLEAQGGHSFVYSHGSSLPSTVYESASSSKWPAAAVILNLVDQGHLSLDSTPHDLISFWTEESAITLRDLLSFTSGFHDEPCLLFSQGTCVLSCVDLPNADYASCIEGIYNQNIASHPAPGSVYYYANNHLQIAGLMAMNATGKTWSTIFSDFQEETGLFTNSIFNLPSETNPRLAGGMRWTGNDYQAFLRALYWNRRPKDNQPLFSQNVWNALLADQRGSATVGYSPVWLERHQDWSYGLGNWLECPTATERGSFDCGAGHRNSSAGAYGGYPFIDFDYDYFGIVARQGPLGTFPEGIKTFQVIEACARKWSQGDTTPPSAPSGLAVM